MLVESIKCNDNELVDVFWRIVVGKMNPGLKVEFAEAMSKVEEMGWYIDFKPSVEIVLKPKITRPILGGKIH